MATVRTLSPVPDLESGALALKRALREHIKEDEDLSITVPIDRFCFETLFSSQHGMMRTYFKSRDLNFIVAGVGIADKIQADDGPDALSILKKRTQSLLPHQCYIGGSRFDEHRAIEPEWQAFGQHFFILPLLMVEKSAHGIMMMLNFKNQGQWPFSIWKDQAFTVLEAMKYSSNRLAFNLSFKSQEESPHKDEYFHVINKSLKLLDDDRKKVVIGRRNALLFDNDHDPLTFFSSLSKRNEESFLFFIDDGKGTSFFGTSPELLYRYEKTQLFTESLAGTRPRGEGLIRDDELKKELLESAKDQAEHALVTEHIETTLKKFGARDLISSNIEIMRLSYVQHLVKRYQGIIDPKLDHLDFLKALHPTPAVSGINRAWALDFIREHEGFDRGFYAGPFGVVKRDAAEFSVAIRSALYHKRKLYIYAASGIVPASCLKAEWEELNNKQKNIMSIFAPFGSLNNR